MNKMDGISVPSRFSCLKIEDEEFHPVSNRSSKKKMEGNPQIKQTIKKTTLEKNFIKKTPVVGKQNSLTINNSSSKTSKKSKSKANQEDKQWEDWKKKDDEFVNENFEQDLQCAMLQSKLDFENQKKNSVSVIITSQEKNKKKKLKTMSLDQFLEGSANDSSKDKENKTEDDSNFFEKVMNSAKQEINREKIEEKRRERNSNIEEVITLGQYQEKLQKQIDINDLLKKELEDAKKEISVVKSRNKTLCSMLSHGEMKDKAAVLLELEKLTTVKEELTEEVTRLHKLLEQERSSTKANCINNTSESHNSKYKEKNKIKKKH